VRNASAAAPQQVQANNDTRTACTPQHKEWQEMMRMIEEQNQDDKARADCEVTLFLLSRALEISILKEHHK